MVTSRPLTITKSSVSPYSCPEPLFLRHCGLCFIMTLTDCHLVRRYNALRQLPSQKLRVNVLLRAPGAGQFQHWLLEV